MKFIDLNKQYQLHKSSIQKRINAVLDHGQYIMGPEVFELEEKLADYVGTKHCIGVSSGTDALLISLMALGIESGDEVIVPAFSFIATAEAVALLGAKPVFIDIDSNTYNITAKYIEPAINEKTKAIIAVSLYGQCPEFDEINKVANRNNIPVIEDGAQSFGATYNRKKSCGLTTLGCTSFFPSKPLGCYGDGGAIFTNDDQLAEEIKKIRIHGQEKRYYHTRIGLNGRLDTLQAAILLEKLSFFDEEIKARQEIAEAYSSSIKALETPIKTPTVLKNHTSAFAQYTIEPPNREQAILHLNSSGTPTAVHYPSALPEQPIFESTNLTPTSTRKANQVLSLPMHPYLEHSDIRKTVDALKLL